MRKLGLLCAGLLLGTFCWPQTGPDSVCEVNVSVPKGGPAQFADARRKHNEFHKAESDTTAILVWQVTTGPSTGSFMTASCGLAWKDLDGNDTFDARDTADIAKTLAPAIAENHRSYYVFRKDLSLVPESTGKPAKMMSVVHYFIKPSGLTQFTDALKRINEAQKQSKYPAKPSRWYVLANGGEGPRYVVVTDRNSWADMQPPEQTMVDMLKQVYGNDDKTMQNLRDSVDHTVSELLEFRGDLSYIPPAK